MTLLLASVRSAEEARICLRAGVDVIDLKEPAEGALGAVTPTVARAVVAAVGGRVPLSATVGDLGGRDPRLLPTAAALVEAGVDILKVGCFDPFTVEAIEALTRRHPGRPVVPVAFAEDPWRALPLARLAAAGVRLIMLDTRDKAAGGLLSRLGHDELSAFGVATARHGLDLGLAGSLALTDLPVLVTLHPAVVGLRGALCEGSRAGALCPERVAQARAAVPGGGQSPGCRNRRWHHDIVA